jgi:pyruvate dehydrogenase E1 component
VLPVRDPSSTLAEQIGLLSSRINWLAAWTIHHANHVRDSRDGLKVGGHQASCASMATLMAALYFHALRPQDRVAVKPHASPLFHAIQTLFGRQTVEQLKGFRAFGGAQSYPSRTKDRDDVDFSTGSVGLGVAMTSFASLTQEYLAGKGHIEAEQMGRMISFVGDAEMDEGNIYEALIEARKYDLRDIWWILDFNRQSLDAVSADRMFNSFDDIFRACGWRVETIKYGRALEAAFAQPGGKTLRDWLDGLDNETYAALTFEGGPAWRSALEGDLAGQNAALSLIANYDDDALHRLMTDLGGHCAETVLSAYARMAASDQPVLLIAYTSKGRDLPFDGHKDNHAGLMNPPQIEAYRERLGVKPGEEWDALSGLERDQREALEKLISDCAFAQQVKRRHSPIKLDTPTDFPMPVGAKQSTQAAFGKIMGELAKRETPFSDALVTTSPDVTVSTNLGGFVNRRGLYGREVRKDLFKERKLASPQFWAKGPGGQHLELGIAENNLFILLGALGLAGELFNHRLLPVGTLYDPFIARGLDALNYAVYQNARFLLVATPSGLTLGPEGGAHQSISSPLVGLGQPGLTYWEPAFADELSVIMEHAFTDMQEDAGGAHYLRLSTRVLEQPKRHDESWRAGALKGAYWRRLPGQGARICLVSCGAITPEAQQAFDLLREDDEGAGWMTVTSPDRLYHDWQADPASAPITHMLSELPSRCGLVTMIDGAPATLSWLGSVCAHHTRSLGVTRFGQTGDLPDLYREYRLDADAVLDAAAQLLA